MRLTLKPTVLLMIFGFVCIFAMGCNKEKKPAAIDLSPAKVEGKVPETAADSPASQTSAETFKLPYPERVQLFRQPRVASHASAVPVDDDVRLKGFVDINGLHAILSIDGEVATVAPGETHHNVQVVEIAPPVVTLQRGRLRWKQALYGMVAEK